MAAKKRGRFINWQRTKEINTKKKYSGESSPYWEHVDKTRNNNHKQGAFQNERFEYPTANPDLLVDPDSDSTPTINTRLIMKNAIKNAKFSCQEKAVLNCIGIQGFTEEKTAKTLGMGRRQVRICLTRAQKKCEKIFAAKSRHAGVMGTEHTEDEE